MHRIGANGRLGPRAARVAAALAFWMISGTASASATESAAVDRTVCVPDAAGTPVAGGELQFEVTELRGRRAVGDSFKSASAAAGTMFLVVHYTVGNSGGKPVDHGHDVARLRDGRKHDHAQLSAATAAYALSKGLNPHPHSLEPGQNYPQAAVFQIPVESLRYGQMSLIFSAPGKHHTTTDVTVPLSCMPHAPRA